MGKRAATANQSPSKKIKASNDVPDTCAPVFELIDRLGDAAPQTARDMLRSVAPLCLKTPREERHEYQHAMLDQLAKVFAELQAQYHGEINVKDAAVAGAVAEKARNESGIASAQATATTKRAERDAKNTEMTTAQAALEATANTFAGRQAHEKALEAELAEAASQKVFLENILVEKFGPLKVGDYPGSQSRLRNKHADALITEFEKLCSEKSLCAGLEAALKTKTAERGKFAAKCIEAGEKLLAAQIGACVDVAAREEAEKVARRQAVDEAESANKAANDTYNAKVEEFIVLENDLLDKDTVCTDMTTCIKTGTGKIASAQSEADECRSRLVDAQTLIQQFEALRAGERAGEAPAASEEAPAVAVADMEIQS